MSSAPAPLGTAGCLLVQATLLILVLAANTSFSGFPLLASFAGADALPRQLRKRGHQLVYSNGIIALAAVRSARHRVRRQENGAAAVVRDRGGDLVRPRPGRLDKHHLAERESGWRHGLVVNGLGALVSVVVLVVIIVAKFNVTIVPYRLRPRPKGLATAHGKVGFTGGVGIAEEWTGNCEAPTLTRHPRPRGEADRARPAQRLCRQLGGGDRLHASGRQHLPDVGGFNDGVHAQVTRSTAQKGSTDAEQLFYAAITCARERIWLTTAYFAPRQAFVDAVRGGEPRRRRARAHQRPHTDHQVVRQAGRRCYEQLLGCGERIFEYQHTMLHAKVLVVGSHWVTVGSVNFDNRSFALNDELNISFRDPGVVADLEKHFLADLEDARELNLDAWRARALRCAPASWPARSCQGSCSQPAPALGCAPVPRRISGDGPPRHKLASGRSVADLRSPAENGSVATRRTRRLVVSPSALSSRWNRDPRRTRTEVSERSS